MLPSLLDPARHTLLAGPRADEQGRSDARSGHWDRADLTLRAGFGAIWLVDAYLKWQPAFQAQFLDLLQNAAKGQPAWLAGWFHLWTVLVALNPRFFALSTAATETYLAAALLAGFALKSTYLLGAGYSLLIWATAEGFGGVAQPGATDLGAAIVYAVVFLALLALLPRRGTRRYAIDALIARRLPGWRRVAA